MIVALLTVALGVVALGLLVASALSKDPDMRDRYFQIAMILTVITVVLGALSRMFSNTNRLATQNSSLPPGYTPMPPNPGGRQAPPPPTACASPGFNYATVYPTYNAFMPFSTVRMIGNSPGPLLF